MDLAGCVATPSRKQKEKMARYEITRRLVRDLQVCSGREGISETHIILTRSSRNDSVLYSYWKSGSLNMVDAARMCICFSLWGQGRECVAPTSGAKPTWAILDVF